MGTEKLSQHACHFLRKNIREVADLEILLLLRTRVNHSWSIDEVSNELRLDPSIVSNHLIDLFARGLIQHDDSQGRLYQFLYRPEVDDKEVPLREIALTFERARGEILARIADNQQKHLQAFADAFIFRRRKEEDGES
jgi:predicted ArsR family transcriptional regulator